MTSVIGLIFLFFFNYLILKNNQNILNKIDLISIQIEDITNYLQNNAIIRIPQFNEKSGEIILSEPQLDPSLTQNHLISKYLNQTNNIRIYDSDLIKFADTENLYLPDDVIEVDIEETDDKMNFFRVYKEKYFKLFINLQQYFDKKKIQHKYTVL